MKRNRRSGVEDRWFKAVKLPDGTTATVESATYGKGNRWRARYVDDSGKEHAKGFARKVDAQRWLDKQVSDQVTGTWTDPALSAVSFGVIAERWISTKATRAPKTVAGYRSLLDTVVLPRWRDVALRELGFDDLQVWISGLSVDGSMRFEGKGLRASRVRQAHQLMGSVLRFAIKARHLTANPADGIERGHQEHEADPEPVVAARVRHVGEDEVGRGVGLQHEEEAQHGRPLPSTQSPGDVGHDHAHHGGADEVDDPVDREIADVDGVHAREDAEQHQRRLQPPPQPLGARS